MNSFSAIICSVPRLGGAVQKRFLLAADGPGDAHMGVRVCVEVRANVYKAEDTGGEGQTDRQMDRQLSASSPTAGSLSQDIQSEMWFASDCTALSYTFRHQDERFIVIVRFENERQEKKHVSFKTITFSYEQSIVRHSADVKIMLFVYFYIFNNVTKTDYEPQNI